jgi:hypothetical protein
MAYLDQVETFDAVAQLNARIGGLRKSIREKKTAIADLCIARYCGAASPSAAVDRDINLWCGEILEQEDQIRELLEQIQEYKSRQIDSPAQVVPPEADPLVFSTKASFAEPETAPIPPSSYAPRFVAPVVPEPEPVPPAPILPTYTPEQIASEQREQELRIQEQYEQELRTQEQRIQEQRAQEQYEQELRAQEQRIQEQRAQEQYEQELRAQEQRIQEQYAQESDAMVSCSVCGVKNLPGTRFCQECGERMESYSAEPPVYDASPDARPVVLLEPFYCPDCGEPGMPGDKFCGICGARVA